MPSTYNVGVVFEALGSGPGAAVLKALPEATIFEAGRETTVRARIHAPGPGAAVSHLVERVTKAARGGVALRIDQDLVSVSDIARRVSRTRESVRLLIDGKRGPGGFPAPLGTVGDGIRIWPW
jgi:DNA-binding IclR family transcriptional regulator